jgi:hypothetical protein
MKRNGESVLNEKCIIGEKLIKNLSVEKGISERKKNGLSKNTF